MTNKTNRDEGWVSAGTGRPWTPDTVRPKEGRRRTFPLGHPPCPASTVPLSSTSNPTKKGRKRDVTHNPTLTDVEVDSGEAESAGSRGTRETQTQTPVVVGTGVTQRDSGRGNSGYGRKNLETGTPEGLGTMGPERWNNWQGVRRRVLQHWTGPDRGRGTGGVRCKEGPVRTGTGSKSLVWR